jgi:deoxyribodipyrimidine photo-lyase
VRRYVPELGDLAPARIQVPWQLDDAERKQLDYPDPIVELS